MTARSWKRFCARACCPGASNSALPRRRTELDALLALYAHLHDADDPLPDRTVVEGVWRELMANDRYRYPGGYVEDTLVSSCTITVIPNLTRGCRAYGLIENVVIQSSHRNRGVR